VIEAKSMYFGGEIVAASECDYESYARLGLKCPFCDSAVFVRSSSFRKIKGVEKPIGAYFAHFPSGYTDNWDCEARSRSKAGREHIERIKILARGQRLKVYNSKLWQLISADRNIKQQRITSIRKVIGERWIDSFCKLVRREIFQNLEDLYVTIDLSIGWIDSMKPDFLTHAAGLSAADSQREYEVQTQYFAECDRRMHRAICYEVIEFLGTNSGGWALNKLVTIAAEIQGMTQKITPAEVREGKPSTFALTIAAFLVGTHWVEIMDKIENNGVES
jgi:hypothetical protein